ncbi:MAG TPA: hypothetical protein VF710_18350 [Longimicrobium sp.]|jgi:hypothetical protein
MYRSCIYCSADLGANQALESFPVGRRVAFDAERGRLWAVCGSCARWNLAPIEERWEAVDEAERGFRDARLRAQSENIGLARLADGTTLIRVGAALAGEMAAWRYGEQLRHRRSRYMGTGAGLAGGAGMLALAGTLVGGGALLATTLMWRWVVRPALQGYRDAEVLHTFPSPGGEPGARIHLRRRDVAGATLHTAPGGGVELHLPPLPEEAPWIAKGVLHRTGVTAPLVVADAAARRMMERAMVAVNARGARRRQLDQAVKVLEAAGSAEGYLAAAARKRLRLHGGSEVYDRSPAEPNPVAALALEMALHEEQERRAMEGELAVLEAAWRDAEHIAEIADRLAVDGG